MRRETEYSWDQLDSPQVSRDQEYWSNVELRYKDRVEVLP